MKKKYEIERKKLYGEILKLIPTAAFDEEYTTGEVIIATGLKNKGSETLKPIWDLPNRFEQYNMDLPDLKADETIRTRRENPPR